MSYIFIVLLLISSSFASSVSTLEDENGIECCYEDEALYITNKKKEKTVLCKSAFNCIDTSALYKEIIHRVEITNFIINNETEEFLNDLLRIIHETNVAKEKKQTLIHEEEEETPTYDYGFWFYNCTYSFNNTGTESNESSSKNPALHVCQHFEHFNIYLEEGEKCKNVLHSLKQWHFAEQNKKSQ